MNIFLSKRRHSPKSSYVLSNRTFGLGLNTVREISRKRGFGLGSNPVVFQNIVDRKYKLFDKFLRVGLRKNIDNIKKQASWAGLRHRQGLPVRGQRTHSNSKTSRKT